MSSKRKSSGGGSGGGGAARSTAAVSGDERPVKLRRLGLLTDLESALREASDAQLSALDARQDEAALRGILRSFERSTMVAIKARAEQADDDEEDGAWSLIFSVLSCRVARGSSLCPDCCGAAY